jgi:hypothetical protein
MNLSSNIGAVVDGRIGRSYRDKRGTPYDRASQRGRPRDAFDHTASMSWKALDWATDIRVGSPTIRLILILLANKAAENSLATPQSEPS